MSDRYYRGLRNFLNDTKYKLQLTSMTSKINENKNNINGIKSDISGINDFSDKINDNETNISSNLTKINDNENSISNNLEKIDNFTQYILKSGKDFEKNIQLKNKYLDLIEINIFIHFLKKKLNMTLLKILYYV